MVCCNVQHLLNKPHNQAQAGKLHLIKVPKLPFLEVGLDFTGPLPASKLGKNYLLTITDYTSSMVLFVPCDTLQFY